MTHSDELLTGFDQAPESPQPALLRHVDLELALRTPDKGFRTRLSELFDLGAFTLDSAGNVLVSEQVHGTMGFPEVLRRHQATGFIRRCGRNGDQPQPTWPGTAAKSSKARHAKVQERPLLLMKNIVDRGYLR